MATKSMAYDNPTYISRDSASFSSVAGASAVGCKFANFTNSIAYSATAIVQVAGTSAGAGAAAIIQLVSGTATTALGTLALGSSAANTVVTTTLTNVPGGVAMLPGDVLRAVNGTDATSTYVMVYEYQVAPIGSVTV